MAPSVQFKKLPKNWPWIFADFFFLLLHEATVLSKKYEITNGVTVSVQEKIAIP